MANFLKQNLSRYKIKNFILLNQDTGSIIDNNNTKLETNSILSIFNSSTPFTMYEESGYIVSSLTTFKKKQSLIVIHNSKQAYFDTLEDVINLFFSLAIDYNSEEQHHKKNSEFNLHNQKQLNERRQLELHFAQAVRTADFNKLDFLTPKLFYYLEIDKYTIKSPQFKNYMFSLITVLTRIAMEEGVILQTAYSLSDHYFFMNFNECGLTPLELDLKIVKDFANLIKLKHYSFSSPLINKAIKYILNNIYSPLTISTIAKECDVTLEYLSTTFKNITGINIKEYISIEKVKVAKFLLVSTDLSIQRIALDLGYSDHSHFSKTFKKITNLTPTAYRKITLS